MAQPLDILVHRYRLRRQLGSGGMGTTWEADDTLEEERIALKLLRSDADQVTRSALQREFRLLCGRMHPGLVHVRDLGFAQVDGSLRAFYTMDLVAGAPLAALADDSSTRFDDLREPLGDVLEALGFLHRLGIRHGDVKPANILVAPSGGVLIDLGCAATLGEAARRISGTPGFVAPEVLRGEPADERADLFSFGKTLCALADAGIALPSEVERLAERMVCDDPAARPTDAREVRQTIGDSRPRLRFDSGASAELLGRERHVQAFDERLEELIAGQPGDRAFCISGPRGSGRTRLLQTLKWRAELRMAVVEGSARKQHAVVDLLSRAVGRDVGTGLANVLSGLSELSARPHPTLLVLDDVDRLSTPDRQLWDRMRRALPSDGSALMLCAGSDLQDGRSLEPLSENVVALWGRRAGLRPSQSAAVFRWSGGVAALVETAVATLRTGGRLETRRAGMLELPELSADHGRALAAAAMGGHLDEAMIDGLRIAGATLAELVTMGMLRREGQRYRLSAVAEAERILRQLPTDVVAAVRDALVSLLSTREDPEASACHVALLIAQGRLSAAEDRFLASEVAQTTAPWAWRALVDVLAEQSARPEVILRIARVLMDAGEPERAREHLQTLPPTLSPSDVREALLLRAEAALRLRRHEAALADAEAVLETAQGAGADPEAFARATDLRARVWIAQRDYARAHQASSEALEMTDDPHTRARLQENVGLAAGYRGALEEAMGALASVEQFHAETGRSGGLFRVLSYQAILHQRKGDFAATIPLYQRALSVAEQGGLDDRLAHAWLNLGTALQEHGDWGAAIDAYERGLRFAEALGLGAIEASLWFNLANLYTEVGLLERAASAQQRSAELANMWGMSHLDAHLLRVAGEIAGYRGEVDEARTTLLAAQQGFVDSGAEREAEECELLLLQYALGGSEVAERLEVACNALQAMDAADLVARAKLLMGRHKVMLGEHREALRVLQGVREEAEASQHRLVVAEIDAALVDCYRALGMAELADTHRRLSRQRWQRIAATLPSTFRDRFSSHPRRCGMLDDSAVDTSAVHTSAVREASDDRVSTSRLRRFIAVNRKLNSTLSVKQVAEHAMDAAIELTSAERGFVLLSDEPGQFRVSAARNLDRERVSKSHGKFSRSIAERVIESDTPVVTVDAQQDTRFREQLSIHAMRLQSVACVPIRSPDGVLGALYLDNRFERGRFAEGDIELLQAFADQVAIAITNAELHAALEARTRELEHIKEQQEEHIRGQAQQIQSLTDEVRAKQEALEYRYDYSRIIGRGAKMRTVFAILDRVIDSNLSVLVQGESGTGKELIARAIHFNSPRRDHPLVSLNCAALPDNLIESELFGHERGAFTGADQKKHGLLVTARGGTVFLDELGETSPQVQAKLLRALQEREIRPIGATETIPIDIRLVCATNKNLRQLAERGDFREDLYYRVSVVEFTLPPLRERIEDLPDLIDHLLPKANDAPTLSPAARRALLGYRFPGNVRELENILKRASVLAEGDEIQVRDLGLPQTSEEAALPTDRAQFEQSEARRIHAALSACGWNVSRVSRELGIPRQSLYRKLRRYRIERPEVDRMSR